MCIRDSGVSLLLFASLPVSSRCTLLKLHLAFSLLVVAYTFSSLTSHCRLTCIGCLVHSMSLSVMVNAPSPHPPSTHDCHPGIIVVSKCSLYTFYGNPAPVIRSMQFHYCTVSNPGTGADDAFVLKCCVTPHGLHTADRR